MIEHGLHRRRVALQPQEGHALGDRRRVVHDRVGQVGGAVGALAAVLVALVQRRHRAPLLEDMRRHAVAPQQRDGGEDHLQHARVLRQALGREADLDVEAAVVGRVLPGAGRQRGRQALGLQHRQQAAGALVAEHVADLLGRLGRRPGPQVGQRKLSVIVRRSFTGSMRSMRSAGLRGR
jgi:hypothetical protein